MKVADDWIWTLVLLYLKQTRCQLCHDHCPKLVLFSTRSTQTAPSVNNSVHVIKGRKMKQTHICPIYTLTAKLELNGSVTRLSYFPSKVAKTFQDILNSVTLWGTTDRCGYLGMGQLLEKKDWVTFYSNIWSYCLMVQLILVRSSQELGRNFVRA